ncbi:TPA: transcriptional regulator [Clostridioides difficile]|uniref:HTH cro/C1-type domain-containing protein n=2 Tax=root TaxID=1 RepID=A0A0A8WIG0_9CAUD|nr:helix-turn-helix domain-containing protein [Clostridioides difficile]YP_009206167.1 transcriptional regulator [Clostridium phage phiMMP01]AXU30852.1 BetR domain protein [Clostridioides difficile]AXU34640.1 BetR domain protein [Clostridioides difficile]EGT3644989.1 transcriptional regulator [Clostridioides difficile]EGT3661257.1 transcriptional regulator [Clostridioides difficile]EGT3664911.1 transcriptional regulator [Clostridioides difficile]
MYLNRLEGLMKENRHTQKNVADILGLSSYGFRLKLKGKNEFKASEIKKISKLYNVSADYFFSDEVAKIAIKEERGNNNEESNHNQAK